jgi:hypothetical protein
MFSLSSANSLNLNTPSIAAPFEEETKRHHEAMYDVKETETTVQQDYPVALAAISEILVPFDDDEEEEEFQMRFVMAKSLRELNDAMTVAPPPDLSSSSPAYYAALSSATHVTSTTTTSTVAIVETPAERRGIMDVALKKRGL